MKAFFIIPTKCPIERDVYWLTCDEVIQEESFLKLFDNFSPADIFNGRKINNKYYTEWMCDACAIAGCEVSKCKLRSGSSSAKL
jgi:hypothetical protein